MEYATPRRKKLLIVEDNPAEQMSIRELLGHDDIDVLVASTGADAITALSEQPFDCAMAPVVKLGSAQARRLNHR